jgi:phosphocarrier protein HPr
MKTFKYDVMDELGLHARPAGLLVKQAKNYQSRITIDKDGNRADASKLMAVMSLGIKKGQTVIITIEGDDEAAAYQGVLDFLKENL